jgi:hypothetical protein
MKARFTLNEKVRGQYLYPLPVLRSVAEFGLAPRLGRGDKGSNPFIPRKINHTSVWRGLLNRWFVKSNMAQHHCLPPSFKEGAAKWLATRFEPLGNGNVRRSIRPPSAILKG